MDYLIYLPILIIIGAMVLVYVRRNDPVDLPLVSQPVMTAHELALIEKLAEAAGSRGLHVLPQVSMGAFLTVKPGTDKSTRASLLNKILKKRSDFILVDEKSRVQLIVELDDRSHRASKDEARDQLAAAAGIRTVRLRNARALSIQDIQRAISTVPA